MYKLAIFDFDGTLVDSAPGIVEITYQVQKFYGFHDQVVEEWKQLIGVPLNDQAKIILPGEKPDFHIEVADKYREFYNSQAVQLCPPFPALGLVLEQLRTRGIMVTIASSKRKLIIDPVLEHYRLEGYFNLVLGADCVSNHKPHPEPVLNTLEKLRCQPEDAVVIGDSSFDLEMANNAGVDSIGVTTGIHTREKLDSTKPTAVVDTLTEAMELILEGKKKAA